jgi:hypothetical protein
MNVKKLRVRYSVAAALKALLARHALSLVIHESSLFIPPEKTFR